MAVFKSSLTYFALGLACIWCTRLHAQEQASPCDSVCRAWTELTSAPEKPQSAREKKPISEAASKPPGPSAKSKHQVTTRRNDEYLHALRDEASVRARRASRSQSSVPTAIPPKTDSTENSGQAADGGTTGSIAPQTPSERIPRYPSPDPSEGTKDITADAASPGSNERGGPDNSRGGSSERGSPSDLPNQAAPLVEAARTETHSEAAKTTIGSPPSARPRLRLPGFPLPTEEDEARNKVADKTNTASLAASSGSQFRIVQNVETKKCSVVDTKLAANNTTTSIILTGIVYTSRAEAEAGMKVLRECGSPGCGAQENCLSR